MIHVWNHLPMECNLQFALLEKRIGEKDKPLTVEEIRAELSLRSEINEDNEELEEHELFCGQFKGKCRNCRQIGQKLFQCKNRSSHNDGNNNNTTGGNYCSYCCKSGHVRQKVFKLKKKETRYPVTMIMVTVTEKTMTHKM
jgi:hypothetical protein